MSAPTPYRALASALMITEDEAGFLEMIEADKEVAKVQTADAFGDALVDRIFNGPQIRGTACKIPKLHDKVRFPPGQVTMWYGVNGHGKSLITSQVALDMAFQEEPVLIDSFEMGPLDTLHRMVKQSAGSDLPTREWVYAFLAWAHKRLWIYNHRGQAASKRVLDLARYAALRHGVKHVVIDSLMKVVRSEEDYDGQKRFVDRCCEIAIEAGLHVHLVHHVRKGTDEYDWPNKFDAKGSGSITDQVDCAIGVWRNKRKEEKRQRFQMKGDIDFDEGEIDAGLWVAKNRHIEWEGKLGLWYVPGAQAYTDIQGKPIRYDLGSYMQGVPT